MSNINENLKKIESAVWGKDVRKAIHDSIHDCYEDGKAGTTDLLAREGIENLENVKADKTEVAVERARINNLSKMKEGSTTGDAEIQDIRIGADGKKYPNAGEAVRGQLSELKKDLIYLSSNTAYSFDEVYRIGLGENIEPEVEYVNRYIGSGDGILGAEQTVRCASKNMIFVPKGSTVSEQVNEGYMLRSRYCYDLKRNFLGLKSISELNSFLSEESLFVRLYTSKGIDTEPITPEEAKANVHFLVKSKKVSKKVSEITKSFVEKFSKENLAEKKPGKNVLDTTQSVNGYINDDRGNLQSSDTYNTSDYIKIKGGNSVVMSPRIRKFLSFDLEKTPIKGSYVDAMTTEYVFYAENDCYIRISYYKSDEDSMQIEYGTKPTEYEPYHLRLDDKFSLTKKQTEEVEKIVQNENIELEVDNYNVLRGKKWAVVGDSFSNGDFTGSQEDYIIREGKYAGKNAVYGYLIGNRNGMEIQHLAAGGRTLATPADGSFTNCVTQDNVYKVIDSDVDYITIYIGINDSHHAPGSSGGDGEDNTGEITIGEITDDTISTFYGAWNVVIKHWIETYPFAKIGIIVSNGCGVDDYRIATIEIAKKWGIPYIDLNGDERTPMMNRSTNPNVTNEAKNARNVAFMVTETNQHPNVKAHEYESYIIENFLKSL